MNTDSYYEIGASHRTCEDYTLTGQYDGMAYAILCDGCSDCDHDAVGARIPSHTDVGARLLAHITKGAVIYLKKRGIIGTDVYPMLLQELLVRKCLEIQQSLGVTPDVFDATLLVSVVLDGKATTIGWGDGYLIFVKKDNTIDVVEAVYSSGAPYYLSYELSLGKKEAYTLAYGNDPISLNEYTLNTSGDVLKTSTKDLFPTFSHTMFHQSSTDDLKAIVLSSDGANTYQDNPKGILQSGEEKRQYKAIEIIPTMVRYKSLVGEFATRRMLRMKADMEKENKTHFDDISCAAIIVD